MQNLCQMKPYHLLVLLKTLKGIKKFPVVASMTSLEERLVSLRIAFAQIRQLGYKRSQFGLTGTIINVPSDVRQVQQALPRDCNDSMTVAVLPKQN